MYSIGGSSSTLPASLVATAVSTSLRSGKDEPSALAQAARARTESKTTALLVIIICARYLL